MPLDALYDTSPVASSRTCGVDEYFFYSRNFLVRVSACTPFVRSLIRACMVQSFILSPMQLPGHLFVSVLPLHHVSTLVSLNKENSIRLLSFAPASTLRSLTFSSFD